MLDLFDHFEYLIFPYAQEVFIFSHIINGKFQMSDFR